MAHPDEVVAEVQDVEDVPSKLISEAQQRHEFAKSGLVTEQEKKQAAVEEAHALSTRPDGSYAQLHESANPTLAVADEQYKAAIDKDQKEAVKVLQGEVKAEDSPASMAGTDQPASSGDKPKAAPKSVTDKP